MLIRSRERTQNASSVGVSVYRHARSPDEGGPLAPAALLARRGQRTLSAQPGGMLGQRIDQRADGGGVRLDIDPQAELGCGLGGLWPYAGDDRPRVRLAGDADQVSHRRAGGETYRVKPARLDHFPGSGRRRRGPHGPVGGDVLDLPATLSQSLGQRFGGDVGARQQTRFTGSKTLS